MIPFGPQLIGQTEKALNAVLCDILADYALTEADWVTLRLTDQFDGQGKLPDFIANQAQFVNASSLVVGLVQRGLIAGSSLTTHGQEVVADIGARIAESTGSIWRAVDPEEAVIAGRVLNEVLKGYRLCLTGDS